MNHLPGRANPRARRSNKSAVSRIATFCIAGIAALSAPIAVSAGTSNPGLDDFARGRLLVEPRAGLSRHDLDLLLATHGGKARKLGQSNLHIVDLQINGSEKSVLEKLSHDPRIKFAELDRRVKSTYVPNDPYFGSQYHLAKTGTTTAWDTTQGAGITIAILDSGIDSTHPDLTANLVPGYNFYDNSTNTSDVCGHGTAVAGTAAASTNNGSGVAGVAGQSKIMPVRIAYFDTASNSCYAYYSTISSGLTYAADHGARIANISYGGVAGSTSVQSAAQYMKNKGGLVFVSAGNNGINENIAPTMTMIPVSATDGNDALTSWSSYGSFVALSAPGAGIWTTSKGGIYQSWNGTSFSSPLAAGIGALMMAANPALDGSSIESLMYSTAVDLGGAGRDVYFGYGRVNAAAGVQAALAARPVADTQAPTASIAAPVANSSVSGLVPVNVAAADNVSVTRVELHVNGATVAIDNAAPFSFSWDSKSVQNGLASLTAVAFDAAGNTGTSATTVVNVANATALVGSDMTPPVVTILNPVAGRVSGNVSVSVSATDNAGLAGITQLLYIDGVQVAKTTGGSLAYSWNTRKAVAGTHTIQAVASDGAGNKSSTSVQVTR